MALTNLYGGSDARLGKARYFRFHLQKICYSIYNPCFSGEIIVCNMCIMYKREH